MSTTHAYFLIDANSLGTTTSVTRIVTRILVYLASRHDSCTWNFEVLDLQSRPRALTAHAKRRIRERRLVTSESLHALTTAVCADVRSLGTKQAMARTLRERLMCLEADIEWGDPALMRSPTRGPTARAWMDPTQRNESMSVRSFLYIIGDLPTTPDEIDVFLGPAVDHATLLEKLTQVRDCLIGDGIWESYARKRVGVSWIRASPHTVQSPVDTIVDSVMGCCMEALGGCMMSLRELDQTSVPFSSMFGRKHRVCTHPGWSRKFAREVSAVADYLLAGRVQDGRRAWALKYGANTCATGSGSVLVEAECDRRSWLNDGRLARRYDLPELVALAAHARTTHMQHEAHAAACAVELKYLLDVPTHVWPLITRHITCAPAMCHAQGHLSNDQVVIAQQSNAGVLSYVAVVPVGRSMVAVYPMDARVFACVMDVVGRVQVAKVGAGAATVFRAAWLEDWTVWADDLDVVPSEQCAVDVEIDMSLIDAYKAAAGPNAVQSGKLSDETADTIPANVGSETLISGPTDSLASSVPTHAPVTLDAWYADLYIKTIQQPSPEFDHAISTIQPIIDNVAASTSAETAVTQLYTSVLQSSASIEDVFTSGDAQDNTEFAASRQAATAVADNSSSQRTWQLHECQLQILLHLLAIDRCRLWQLDSLIETHGLVESLNDLVDQLCIWTSVDDIFCSANGQTSGAGDLAAVFIGGPNVAQFTERLGDIVDELRVQCGWVPTADTDTSTQPNVHAENKRRKGTPRKMADAGNRSEIIVQPHAHKPLMSGRKLARHLDELISKRRSGSGSNDRAEKSLCVGSGEPPAQRRKSVQLKMPLQLIRQLKSEVVSTTRPLVSRSRTMSGRSNSSGGMWQAKRSNVNSGSMRQSGRSNASIRQVGRSNASHTLGAAKARAPLQRPAIPEFADLSSSPSISGRVNDMHLVPETPSKKRQRTRDEDPSSPLFIPASMPMHTFIYESDESDARAEQSPLCGQDTELVHEQSSRRVLRFPGSRGH
ncbi:hypothetical protein IW148_004114 [Coemansia sp. RSA 1199]|nr:hypothetical protein IW148_004114 [Coemansia sp. RSA 1199]